MRADRLIALIMLLADKRKNDFPAVGKRTGSLSPYHHPDMIALNTAGIPVTSEAWERGGVVPGGNFRSSLTGLTENENQCPVYFRHT